MSSKGFPCWLTSGDFFLDIVNLIAILGLAWSSSEFLDSTTPNSPGLNSSHAALPQAQHADMERLRERERLVEQLKMQYHLAQKLLEPQEDRGR